jgi:FtsH-binding integral membrane protein
MSKLAITFGTILVLLGVALGAYTYAALPPERQSPTAFIPAIFGILLIICGVLARNDKFRMHAMHVAALIGLVGCVMPLWRAIGKLVSGADLNLAIGSQIAMGVICGLFVALCVRSFIAARRARKSSGSA